MSPQFYSGGQYLPAKGKQPRDPPPIPSDVLQEMLRNKSIHIVQGNVEEGPGASAGRGKTTSVSTMTVKKAAKPRQEKSPRPCHGWSAEDSKRAIKQHRQRQKQGIVGPNVQWGRLVAEEDEREQEKRREVLAKRRALMQSRPWTEPAVEEYPMPRPRALRNRCGQFIHNPQTTLTEQLFCPLQYDNRSSFHELIAGKKKGADFRSVSPRLHIDVVCRKSQREEKEREQRMRSYNTREQSRSYSAPAVKRRQIEDTPTTEDIDVTPPRTKASVSPTPHRRYPSVSPGSSRAMRGQFILPRDSDHRLVNSGKASAKSAWALSTSPKIGSYNKQYMPV